MRLYAEDLELNVEGVLVKISELNVEGVLVKISVNCSIIFTVVTQYTGEKQEGNHLNYNLKYKFFNSY